MSNPVSIYEARDNRIQRNLLAHIRYALQYRAFFVYWVRRGLVTRYSQTSVGFLWAIFQPLLSSLVYLIVFSVVARVSTEPVPYPLFIVTSLVLWSYFNRIVFSGAASIIGNLDIITRVQFPREFLPLSVAIEAVVDLLFGIVIIAIFFLIYQQPVTPFILLAIPIFIVQTMLALGLAFFLAAMSTMIRDLFQVLPILLQLLLYVSPVLYPLDIVPGSIRALYLFNPLGPIFAAYQEAILYGRFTLDIGSILFVTALAIVTLIGGYLFFKRIEWRFADTL